MQTQRWPQLETRFCLFKACTPGIYGLGCNEKCGNCRNASECVHINGTCLGVCLDTAITSAKNLITFFSVLTDC